MALAHDIGHGPVGHVSETAFEEYLPGYHHAIIGADVVLRPLNLCRETLDGVRCHSWSLPSPSTPEGHVLSWCDRVAYCTHDFEDAVDAGVVTPAELPEEVADVAGRTRGKQVDTFITALVSGITEHGTVAMPEAQASALSALRSFNYERIYTSDLSMRQRAAAIPMLQSLVVRYATSPALLGRPELDDGSDEALEAAVTYVVGMTDRYACDAAVALLGWDERKLPRAV